MSKKLLSLVITLVLLATSFGALPKTQAKADETVLVIGWEQEPDVLEPLSNSTFSELLQNFYSRPVWDWDAEYNPYPVLVTEIPSIDNGDVTTNDQGNTVVTYHLKQGLLWSDGQPITADDFLFAHRLYSAPSTGTIARGNYPEVVASVEKVDDYTVVQTFNAPFPDFLSDQVYIQARYPQHILEPLLEANGGTLDGLPYFTRAEGVVGYGPYVLESWTPGESITFVKNQYWAGQQPAIDKIIVRFITETAQLRNALETGEIDFAFNFPDELVKGYKEIEGVEVWNTGSVYDDALWFNIKPDGSQHPALKDIKVRQAIVHAINRAEDTAAIVGEGTQVPRARDAARWLPDDLTYLDYDPELARQLLDEAGWTDTNDNGTRDKDGTELILRVFTTSRQTRVDYQLAIQSDLKEVGIGTQLFQVPGPTVLFASFTNRGIQATGDYDLSIYTFNNDPISPNIDPNSLGTQGIPGQDNPSGTNFSSFSNARVDELIPLIRSNADPVSRLEQKHEAVRLITDAVFWAGLFPRVTWYALRTDRFDASSFQNNGTLGANWFHGVENWQLAQ
jgi:peptide/nickel transport system substrate-binding protein